MPADIAALSIDGIAAGLAVRDIGKEKKEAERALRKDLDKCASGSTDPSAQQKADTEYKNITTGKVTQR